MFCQCVCVCACVKCFCKKKKMFKIDLTLFRLLLRVPSLELWEKKRANLVNLWRTAETDTNDKMKMKNNETINDDIDHKNGIVVWNS